VFAPLCLQVTTEDDADDMLFCSASCHKQFNDAQRQNTTGDLDGPSASSKLADSAVNGTASSPQLSQASTSSSPPHPAIKLSICLDPQQGAVAILPGTQTSRSSAEKSLKHKADSELEKVCVWLLLLAISYMCTAYMSAVRSCSRMLR